MLQIKFMAPDKVLFEGSADHIVARSTEGDFAIYKDHINIITTLDISVLKIVDENNKGHKYTVSGGNLFLQDNVITILTKAAEDLENIDIRKAEAKKAQIEKMISAGAKDSELRNLELDLKKQINRINSSK